MKKLFLTFLIFIFLVIPTDVTYAAIAHKETKTNSVASGSSITVSGLNANGTDTVIVCNTASKGPDNISTIVWDVAGDNQSFTKLDSDVNGNSQAEIWYLATATPKIADVEVTFAASTRGTAACSVYTGVNQINPFRAAATAKANGTDGTVTVDVTALDGEMVVDGASHVSSGPFTVTSQSGTSRSDVTAIGGGTDTRGMSQEIAVSGDATKTMSYTMSGSDNWAIVAGALQEPTPLLQLGTHRWFQDASSVVPGGAVALNQAVVVPPQGTPFRLRLNIHVQDAQLDQNGTTTKLQFAEKSGATCEAIGGGETYSDISTTTGSIRFFDNTSVADKTTITSHKFDPRHSSTTSGVDTIHLQTFNDGQNNYTFTNSVAAIPRDEDGLWDFSLVDDSAPAGTSYCFRPVVDDYGVSTLPEIRTQREIRVRLRGTVRLRSVRLW